jgi:hypothetical protein
MSKQWLGQEQIDERMRERIAGGERYPSPLPLARTWTIGESMRASRRFVTWHSGDEG